MQTYGSAFGCLFAKLIVTVLYDMMFMKSIYSITFVLISAVSVNDVHEHTKNDYSADYNCGYLNHDDIYISNATIKHPFESTWSIPI